jgi:hypothetical protein
MPVLRKALTNPERSVRWLAANALARHGREMSREEAERFEQEAERQGDDCALHLLLLGQYFLPATLVESARSARHRHILWLIEHAPRTLSTGGPPADLHPESDGDAYAQAKQLWLKQVEANQTDLTILGNAAQFFTLHDRELSEELLILLRLVSRLAPRRSEEIALCERLIPIARLARTPCPCWR